MKKFKLYYLRNGITNRAQDVPILDTNFKKMGKKKSMG